MKTYKNFILEISEEEQSEKEKAVQLAYEGMNKLVKKYAQQYKRKVSLNKSHFVESHMAERLIERVEDVDKFLKGIEDVFKTTNFITDLPKLHKGYTKNRNRKYGPQLVSPKYKVHVGTEIRKNGKTYDIITKSVMGRWDEKYIARLKSGRDKFGNKKTPAPMYRAK